ncbi:RNA polymerase beta subunit [Iris pallida]|uniref:RNA polymerase beta subunit (Plastid) n=1 Tax=Iris pallida TaxID=29817 RepID=A0AAX6F988_IRIPA|nr:RNA polymerase beta subunit [Iris pallida]
MLRNGNEGMSTILGFSQIQFEGFCRFINRGLANFINFQKLKIEIKKWNFNYLWKDINR